MRYEDASNGAFQGSQPIANDDMDSLPAGSKSAATGNLITGEGTQSGSAGADAAAGAQITAIAGKGGEDSSFAGGRLSVSGEHGRLSVDAEGNYSYQANAGVENVRDRFTYTLADNQGASDTAALIVEIGKTPVVIKADAQQIVPGPDGVVTLPPGVELSDVRVVGRNLVVDLPDGTQLIIIDGAIFVPQLVINGVEVPATNVATLLIGQEPQPAAGEAPPSSGGPGGTPPPPLDPGVPLGDLIPPTEYDYTPPEPQEVDDILDRDPEIQVQPDDQQPSVNAVDSVDEAGLPERNEGEPEGSGEEAAAGANGDPSEATAGTIIIDSPDGVDSVTINGVLVTGVVGQQIAGEFGTLTITGFDGDNILYSYLLDDNTSGDATHDDFAMVVTDDDGDEAEATLTINIIDDVPTARNDTDALPDGADSTDGNVLTGANTTSGSAGRDTTGADALPNGVTGVHAGTSGSFTAVPPAGVSVVGTFGTLEIHSDGSYTYTLSGNQGPGGTDVFTYQIIDGDGDVSTATLTIAVPPDFIPEPNNATAIVDDDGLPNGNNDSAPGDDVVPNNDGDNNETTFSGTLTADFGGDGPGTFTLAAMNNLTQVIGQETVRYTWNDATDTLTAVVEGGARDGLTLFTVELNPNGEFDVTLVNNVLQVDDGTNTENNATAALTFTATDADGDSTNGTLTITFDDDIPTAIIPPPPPQGEPQEPLVGGFVDEDLLPDGNNDAATGDDPGGTTASGGAGSLGALFNAGADQPLTFSLSSNTSGLPALTSNGVPVTYAVVGNVLTASAGGSPVFTLTVNADGSWEFELLGQLDHPTVDTEDNLLLDLSSVVVGTDSDGDDVTGAPGAFVIDVDDDIPVAHGDVNPIVGLVDEDDLPTGNHDDAPGDDDPGNADGDNDGTTTGGGAPSLATLFNGGADQPLTILLSADTSGLPALTSNGVPITYAVVGNVLTGSAGGNTVFTLTVNADGTWEFDLQDQIDHSVPGTEDNLLIDFSSVITAVDADGDTAGLPDDMFVIDIDDDMPQEFEECPDDVIAVNNPGSTFTGDLNLPPVGADEPGVVTFGVSDGDPVLGNGGDPITSEGTPLFYFVNDQGVLEARAGDENGDVIFTITINGDGTFTYEQFGPMGSGGETSFDDLTSASAGNVEFRGVGADDPASTIDLLLSAGPANGVTVNTDSDSIGAANQSMDNGETVRIDFVSDLTTGAATPSGFGYSGHVSTTSFIQLIPQVQGDQSQTTALTVWALNTSNTQANEPDRDPTGGFSDSTITAVEEVTVTDYLSGESTTVDVTGFVVGVFTPVAYGISARVNADGSVTFSGIQQGDSYGIGTGAGEFNAVAVQSEPAGTGGSTQDSFDLGVFSIGTGDVIEPVDITVPIVLTDADGDPVVCDIDIILGPPVDAPDVTVTVNEAGLPIGSDPASNSEIQSGDLQGEVTGGTGPYTFVLVGSGNGAFGTLVLNADGTFTYTLDTPFDSQPDADDGTNPELGAESFTYEATDADGNTQTGTISINIIDDVPTTIDDTDSIAAGQFGPVTGNVVTDASAGDAGDGDNGADTLGADGGTVVGVAAGDTNADLDNPATVGVVIQGTYGKLTLNPDGSYSYTRDPGTDGGVEDVFTYTIEDGDGDRSNATLTITIADSPPTIDAPDQGEAGTVVDEKGLPTRGESPGSGEIADGNGNDNDDTSETTAGVINFTAPDGPAIVRIDGVVVTGVVGQTFVGDHGTLTITSYNAGTGQIGYSYTLEDNTSGDATFDDFAIQVEDQDGDLANDTLVIDIIDDVPTANNDVDSVVGGFDPATGNVLTGTEVAVGEDANGTDGVADVPGADGGTITNIDHAASPAEVVPNGGSVQIQGTYGVLTIYSNGDYSYQRDPGTPGGVEDVFTYTLTDGDGDTDTATLTIGIDDNFPTLPDPALVRLDDDALAGGNAGGTDDDPNTAGLPGQLNGSGGDGDLDYNFTGLSTLPPGFTVNPVDASTVQILQGATVVLTITLNNDTGAFNVVQNNPIDHPTSGESEENLVFQLGVEVEDADGDVEPATITINVDDDTPELSNIQAGSSVDVDETDAGSPAGFPISDTSVGAVITATQAFGADGAAAANSVVYGLAIVGGSPEPSGLVTAIGNFPITLVLIDGNTIQGQYTDGGTQVAFIVEMNADGTVTLTQNVPLEHNTDGSTPAAHNDTLDLAGLINATITITDGDGDTATGSAPIGDNLVFFDDGPDAQVNGQAALDVLTLDETRPEGTDTAGGSAPTGDSQVTANFADNFVAPADHGGDGPGTVSYSLLLSANGIASGLFALDNTDISAGDGDGYGQGASITLSQVGNTITGSAGGTDYFTISIDSNTGVVTFTQLNPIWHPTAPNSFDEAATLTTAAAANVQVVQTVTDSDGDSDTAAINVGTGVFVIQDDGPQAIQPDAASLENEAGASVTADLDDDSEVITDFGEDGPGLVQFANIVNGEDSGRTSDGDAIEYWLSNDGQTLQARTNSTNGIDGDLIFTVQINQATGDYTVTMTGTVDNGAGVSFDDLTSGAAGNVNYRGIGEDDPATAVDIILSASLPGGAATGVNTDSDSIGAANQSMDNGETVRLDFVSNLEVSAVAAGTPMGFTHDGHVDTNSFIQTIPQVQGSQSETVAFRVYALDTNDTQANEPDRNPAGGFSNSSIVQVVEVTVISFDNATPITLDISAVAVGTWTTVGYGISVQKQADGSVIFTGVQQGDQYGISTGGSDFNAVAVTALAAGVGPNAANDSSTDSFDLGVFAIGQVDTGEPIDISFDLQITDADGDTVALPGTIDITLEPATDALAAANFSASQSQSEQLQKSAANSNTLTLATAVAAAGLAEQAAAAPRMHDKQVDGSEQEGGQSAGLQMARHQSVDDSADSASLIAGNGQQAANDSAPAASSSNSSAAPADSGHALDDGASAPDAPSTLPANDQGPASDAVAANPVAPAVAMASAEQLQAAGLDGNAQEGGSVEQVLADALGEGNASATVDAVLDAMAGGNDGPGALAKLASLAAGDVPAWDMGGHGAFGSSHDMMKGGMELLHHDAVQPVANG